MDKPPFPGNAPAIRSKPIATLGNPPASGGKGVAITAEAFADGDLMFVGFDSQNTFHSFLHYPNWNLCVPGIPIIRFRDDSEN